MWAMGIKSKFSERATRALNPPPPSPQPLPSPTTFFVFKTGSHYVALAGLELAMQIRLPLNSEVHLLLPPE